MRREYPKPFTTPTKCSMHTMHKMKRETRLKLLNVTTKWNKTIMLFLFDLLKAYSSSSQQPAAAALSAYNLIYLFYMVHKDQEIIVGWQLCYTALHCLFKFITDDERTMRCVCSVYIALTTQTTKFQFAFNHNLTRCISHMHIEHSDCASSKYQHRMISWMLSVFE